MNPTICESIKSKKIIHFYYDGGLRTVEPFCYGVGTEGNDLLRGYQTGGFSESGNSSGWKLFDLSKASSLEKTNTIFQGIRPYYNPNDKAMVKVYCCI